ncbi:hypothetical protein DMA11_01865 [Marinilabiliaceae bacterium JC017]|nr:hypothetical protein DMA11_01865 [Marinilabiliaceae bacterium JC017]
MPGKPIATQGSMHVCPMCSGLIPHVGGPVLGPGANNVLINGKPAAVMGDMCTCAGPPDTIAQGEPTVLINGTPVATQGSMTAHGGTIVQGDPTIMISSATPNAKATMPVKRIPFPKINIIKKVQASVVGQAGKMHEAEKNITQIKKDAEEQGEPAIYNLQWLKEEKTIRDSYVVKITTLKANVKNIGDGESITFKVKKPVVNENNEEQENDVVELTGTVSDKQVVVEWEVEDVNNEANSGETQNE